jgi:predicted NBD/HSP70 family sugar kinase
MENSIEQTGLSHVDNAARNKNVILNIVRDRSPISRKQISLFSRLSIATTKRLIEELLSDNIIIEVGRTNNARGRKASLLRLNEQYCCSIGVNIIHDALEIAALSFTGAVLLSKKIRGTKPTRTSIQPLLERAIEETMDEVQKNRNGKLLGIGIGIAGLVDINRGIVLYTPNMTGWESAPLGPRLSERFNTDVIIDDSVRCMALSEKRYGCARKLRNYLYIYIGKGVGSGVLLDGRIYRGAHGVAGEFGHITIKQNGNLCNCGNRGCLEAHVSESRIIEDIEKNIASKVHSSLSEHMDEAEGIRLQDIVEHAGGGDKLANLTINNVSENIGIGIANLVNVFDPGVIILGGEVIDTFGESMMENILRVVRLKAINTISSQTSIIPAEVEDFAASRGAATLLTEKHLQNSILNL